MADLAFASGMSTSAAIKRLLRSRLGKQWRPGDRLPPVKELAQQLGTGESNTYQAVRELARDGLLVSRRRLGTFVADMPAVARRGTVGVLSGRHITLYAAGRPAKPFIQRMLNACIDKLSAEGATTHCPLVPDGGATTFDDDADAIVLFNPSTTEPLNCQPHQLMSIVTTTRYVRVGHHRRYDVVGVNEYQGGVLAGQMLRDCGCKRPCFVGHQLAGDTTRYDATSATRLQGFEEGWGSPLPADHLIKVGGYNMLSGARYFKQYFEMKDRYDSVFTASDDIALGFVVAAGSHGFTPGDDFQIVGFDGQDQHSQLGDISLATIAVPCEQMGKRAAQMLIERFADPDRPVNHLSLDCIAHQGTTTRSIHQEKSS